MRLSQLRDSFISISFALIMSVLAIGGYDIVMYLSIMVLVGGLFLDDVSTFLVVSNSRLGILCERNPLIRGSMFEHGIVKGLFISHFNPVRLFYIFVYWIYGAFTGLILSFFYGVDILVIVTAGNSLLGMIWISAGINNLWQLYLEKSGKGGDLW